MTIPMVAWMRYRGHGWRASSEMTAAMFVPTFAALALGWTGVLDDAHAQMGVQHVVMFPAMILVMLLRRDEYTGHAHEPAGSTAWRG
jgi:flagellar biosynthetic protein FliP